MRGLVGGEVQIPQEGKTASAGLFSPYGKSSWHGARPHLDFSNARNSVSNPKDPAGLSKQAFATYFFLKSASEGLVVSCGSCPQITALAKVQYYFIVLLLPFFFFLFLHHCGFTCQHSDLIFLHTNPYSAMHLNVDHINMVFMCIRNCTLTHTKLMTLLNTYQYSHLLLLLRPWTSAVLFNSWLSFFHIFKMVALYILNVLLKLKKIIFFDFQLVIGTLNGL